MKQVIIGGYSAAVSTSDTLYSRLAGAEDWIATEAQREQLVSTSGKLKNLRVKLDGVPGTGTYVFTVRLNGAPTALTCEVAADGTLASDTTHEVTVSAGDRVCLECNPSDAPAPDNARAVLWTTMFEGDTAKESLLFGGADNTINPGGVEYNQVAPSGAGVWGPAEVSMRQVIPTAGKIKNLYVKLSADPGDSPEAYRFTLRLDTGAGLGDTALTCTITADDTTGNDTANEVTVAAGDIVTLQCEPLNNPIEAPYATWGMTFLADTDGESIILAGTNDDPSGSTTEFSRLTGGYGSFYWTTTESSRLQLGQACILKNLYVQLENAPGDGNSFTFTVRIPDPGDTRKDGNLTVTITGAATTTGNDTAHTDIISDDDELSFESDPTSSPSSGDVYWGLVCYIEPPAPPPVEKKHTFRLDPKPQTRMRFHPNLKLG